MTPHIHAELIKAWADGHKIQMHMGDGWADDPNPSFLPTIEYRIKPLSSPDFQMYGYVYPQDDDPNTRRITLTYTRIKFDNLKLTFDGNTRKLKSAEVL